MTQYALRRLVFFVPVLFATSLITFMGINIIPGDPAVLVLGQEARLEDIAAFREIHGLDEPIFGRYLEWLWGMFRGDPGKSYLGGVSISSEIGARLPVTLTIMFFAFTFTMTFGVLFGILAAVFQDSPLDYVVRSFSIFGQSVPEFYALTLLMLVPAIVFEYAPPFGWVPVWEDPWRALRQVVPPTLVLSIGGAAFLMRIVRSSLLEVLRQDYIRTARAKGLQERTVLLRHAVRNSMIPVLTVAGTLVGTLLGGSVILENITSLPGLGQYTFNAVVRSDLNVVMAMTMYAAVVIVSTNLIIDLLYAVVDPRIRYR